MADTVVTDAALVPSDEGLPNIADGNEDWGSAGLQMLLGQAVQSGSYARSDTELDFAGHDGTNDTVDVQPGVAYLALTGETIDVQSALGGSSPPSYDTTIAAATMPAICAVVPTAITVPLQDSTASQVWLAYATDSAVGGVSAGDVYLRSDDTGSVTAPPHPSVELGSANPDNAGADTLLSRFGSPTFNDGTFTSLSTESLKLNGSDIIVTPGWLSSGANMPTARRNPAAAVIDGSLYVAGGFDGSSTLSVLERYDPASDSWTSLTSMPTARYGPGAGVIDGSLYVAGGAASGSNDVLERYDPASDSWTSLTSMPTARYNATAEAIQGSLYVIGGYNGSSHTDRHERYDPASDSWTREDDMPTARRGMGSGADNDEMFVAGGEDSGPLATTEIYDVSKQLRLD